MSEMQQGTDFEDFDEVLAKALQRVDAPEGFAVSVMERAFAPAKPKGRLLMMPRMQAWMGGAIAAALVMGALITARVHVVHQQEQAEMTERQFETAMRVTNQALDQTQMQLRRAGLKLGD